LLIWEDRLHQTNHQTPHCTTTLSFVKANGCPYSKLTPEDEQRTPETCRVAKLKKTRQSDIKLVTYRYFNIVLPPMPVSLDCFFSFFYKNSVRISLVSHMCLLLSIWLPLQI
jgi:hypothetical protein